VQYDALNFFIAVHTLLEFALHLPVVWSGLTYSLCLL